MFIVPYLFSIPLNFSNFFRHHTTFLEASEGRKRGHHVTMRPLPINLELTLYTEVQCNACSWLQFSVLKLAKMPKVTTS
jgi:hypothetical protein